VWHDDQLHLSLGSPTLLAAVRAEPAVTVHLDSGTDVVIVEGHAIPTVPTTPAVLEAYDRKYDWKYEVTRYGNLTTVQPEKVLACRTAGPNGRDSFQRTGCWLIDSG
jgi:hypothetical protein